ncbi:CPA1 family monovalent cation:H+ antiporter [Paenibacillus phyllosphaerae]|uniref:CPA1 family monovalent cation:H+ antiporter n=1 Tax=Paenibacillus phyllosphaerae TaxID=274593 RepID=A0A7W5B2W6_9BACL|nr:sodium:proton antiporter [Paenibacillus phyllosphaerae]MBB3113434.1 CPA1 family monovalent cation:H+ antiporter [Paenibacillus phyllosphaerae]
MHHFNETFIQLLILLAVSMFVIALAKKLNQPYSIALVIVGLLLGVTNIPFLEEAETYITQSHVFQAVIISLFLPILLGDATLKLPFSHLRAQSKPVLALAFGGTLLSFLLIAGASYYVLDLPIVVAFTFAALMSATDPISVISIFKSLGVPKSVVTIIEGESLFNDGIAVVLFQISSIYLLSYMEMGWAGIGSGLWLFLKFAVGGIAIGGVLGYLFSQLIRFYDDYPLEIGFSMLLFFGSFFIAEHFHVSGVIAVVVSGLIFGSYGARIGMSETTQMNIHSFWDVVTLIANSLIFLMIGLEIKHVDFSDKWLLIAAAILIVLLGRTIALYASVAFLRNFPGSWKAILNWGGLKGSLSIALALSLPSSFEGRDDVLVLTFSVVLFSLLVQGLTIKPLVLKLGLGAGDKAKA